MIFSIYAVLLFGDLCTPDGDDKDEERWQWSKNVTCKNMTDPEDLSGKYNTVQAMWVILVVLTVYFCLRDVAECVSLHMNFFTRTESYRNLAIDILLILCIYKGHPHDERLFERWQYHVATYTSFLLWVQTMLTLGKYPGYGKYIIMFK